MSFEELGSVLRAEREKRGLSLDKVAEHLKISARILRSLEEGDDSALPHSVYARGFVRSYGNYLGLDSEELQEAMLAMNDEEQDVQPTSVYATPDLGSSHSGGKFFLILFVLLCAAGAALFWFYRDADLFSELQQARLSTAQPAPPRNVRPEAVTPDSASRHGEAQQAAPAVGQGTQSGQSGQSGQASALRPVPSAGIGSIGAQSLPLQTGQTGQAGQSSQAGPSSQTGQAGQGGAQQSSVIADQGAGTSQANAPAAVRDAPPVSGNHKIIITALAECWIHSNADDADTRQFSLRKGDTFALTFANKLQLKLGNAGGVRIRYNGEDLPPQGKDGQVRTLTFPLSAQ